MAVTNTDDPELTVQQDEVTKARFAQMAATIGGSYYFHPALLGDAVTYKMPDKYINAAGFIKKGNV